MARWWKSTYIAKTTRCGEVNPNDNIKYLTSNRLINSGEEVYKLKLFSRCKLGLVLRKHSKQLRIFNPQKNTFNILLL